MKPAFCLGAFTTLAPFTTAHYNFPYLLVNNTFSSSFLYTRRVSDETHAGTGPSYPPFHAKDLLSEDIRCGRNATISGIDTSVATILAGSKVGFRPNFWLKGTGMNYLVLHDGPLQAYLARSPVQTKEGLQRWDGGDGKFFKIAERGPTTKERWYTAEELIGVQFSEYNFTIPVLTPPGFYLLRMDSVYPRGGNSSQFYAGCAQVEIVGEGGAMTEPGPTVSFPVPSDMLEEYLANGFGSHLPGYKMPGPSVWKG